MISEQERLIDVRHLGRERVIGAWLVGDVIVDPGPTSCLDALLEGLGDVRPRALALTHIHLDHAGAAGVLVRRWPELEVWVHARGAPHLSDPTKLLASAARLYGEAMEHLWGEVAAVPESNLRVLEGGERIGPFEVAYTPGHASHHVSYLHIDAGTAFVGDVGGVRVPPEGFVLAPTPPPDIDLDAWQESLEVVRSWSPARVASTHFDAWEDPGQQLDAVARSLDRWSRLAREADVEQFVAARGAEVAAAVAPDSAACYEQAAPADQSWQGLTRYWSRRSA
jgi:glyoxylase-like metal-dependent hydrolase (beta-lactamase superfamily II)